MNKKVFGVLASVFIALLIFSGCGDHATGKFSEGIIEYDVVLLNTDNPMAFAAPKKMTVGFKDSKCRGEIVAGPGGIVTTVFISDSKNKTLTQLVSVNNKNFYHSYDDKAVKKLNDATPEFTYKITNETKTIAGYKCKRIMIDFKEEMYPDCDAYFTDEIKIKSPNWASPFHEIEGVLLEYQIDKYGMNLRLTATSVNFTSLESAKFEIPEGYKRVTAEYLEQMFN